MNRLFDNIISNKGDGCIGYAELKEFLKKSIEFKKLNKILIIPPDFTRSHSGAGKITAMYYEMLKDTCKIDILPALGTHMALNEKERIAMFGTGIPKECFVIHNWKTDVTLVGQIPSSFVKQVSEGLVDYSIDVEINRRILDKSYDLIISVGQVVPHEVVGMANYSKNIFVGCGGKNMIDQTHMLGAVYGMERIMGRDHSPVRKVFDYAEENFIKDIPLMYVLTVTTAKDNHTCINGIFIGRDREIFEEAVTLSQEKNFQFLQKPLKKVVVYLDEGGFKSTWLGNKAIYRTRMAIEDGGELIVLAPGVRQFGEDSDNDKVIRKYGYIGRDNVLELFKKSQDLKDNMTVAAHLIHGSSNGRFTITYAAEKLTKEEVEGANFKYMPLADAYKIYNPKVLKDGFNTLDNGEEIFFISNPALGLWALEERIRI